MASSLWAEAVSKGRKDGHQEGRIAGAREVCLELVKEHHPKVADHVAPLIEGCSDAERLHEWALQASRLPDRDFLRLIQEQARSSSRSSGRGRTPRPSRKARPKGTR